MYITEFKITLKFHMYTVYSAVNMLLKHIRKKVSMSCFVSMYMYVRIRIYTSKMLTGCLSIYITLNIVP